jgi:prepilin-type N-terminal cleavage/methylation domain-containing protein/prepilin-type processing-associated H-X9-DG protein
MRTRRGFTLIELLVVIAIIAVLMGLLLSAVQSSRNAAARAQCQNHLRQVVLALHQHHDQNGRLPPGHRSFGNPDRMPFSGWTLSILPFVEQSAVADGAKAAYAQSLSPFPDPPHVHRKTVVPIYTCPADDRTRTAQVSLRSRSTVAFTSFLGVSGRDLTTRDGLLFQNSRMRLADALDGASNTLLVGERPPSADLQFGWWYAGVGQRRTGSGDLVLGVREQNVLPVAAGSACGPGVYSFGPSRFDDQCGMFHFWSPHPGGANFGFADGSTRFLRYSAAGVLPALASRAGGETVAVD